MPYRSLVFALVCSLSLCSFAQTAKKLRVLAAPGITQVNVKDWHNTLAPDNNALDLTCRSCEPTHDLSFPAQDISTLRYGNNAYHHWATGIVTGIFSLGAGAIIGFMPHHQHFFSIDLNDGKVIAIQADKSDYKQIAGILQNLTGKPFQVSQKDAHFLAGYNETVESDSSEGSAKSK